MLCTKPTGFVHSFRYCRKLSEFMFGYAIRTENYAMTHVIAYGRVSTQEQATEN